MAKSHLFNLIYRNKNNMNYLVFDTETTGLPIDYNASIEDLENWPIIVEVAWIIVDNEYNILEENDYIINTYTELDPVVQKITGIDNDMIKEGHSIRKVLRKFNRDLEKTGLVIAHNITFDLRVIGAEFVRNGFDTQVFQEKDYFCSMKKSTPILKLNSPYSPGQYKWPKLQQVYNYYFGCDFKGAHRAINDVKATWKVYKELIKEYEIES